MGNPLKGFHQTLSHSSRAYSLRVSAKFNRPSFDRLDSELRRIRTVPLRTLCSVPVSSGIPPEYDEDGEGVYLSLRQLRKHSADITDAKRVAQSFVDSAPPSAQVINGDILLALSGEGTIGKVSLYDSGLPAVLSNFVGRIRLRSEHASLVVSHLLRSQRFQLQIEREKAGMGNLTNLYPFQVGAFRVPVLGKSVQGRLLAQITEIEAQVAIAIGNLRDERDIINKIVCAEFEYPLKEHRERARTRHYTESFSGVARGYMLRSSAKFHHPDFELTEQFFSRTPYVRVKTLIAIPIRLGVTASKGDFVEDGAAYYVHPGATKRQGVIAVADCYQVTEEFYESARRRFGLRSGDVLINRSGEALGKVAYFASDEPAVFSDFTMRFRFNERTNPRFAWYFFRSVMFQAQIERELRGSSLPNIFPPEVERMLVVDCDRARQDSIARAIDEELARLERLRAGIEVKRQEIDRLIEEAVRGAADTPSPAEPPRC